MQLPMASTRGLGLALLLLCLQLFGLASAAASVEHGSASTTPSASAVSGSGSATPTPVADADDALAMIKKALKVLAVVNKDRVDNPVFNKAEFQDVKTDAGKPAEPLDYEADPESHKLRLARRKEEDDSSSSSESYRIPEELAHAAKLVAEATPQKPKGNHSQVAEAVLRKYAPKNLNDTNAPKEQQAPEGLLSKFVQNGGDAKEKRASGYWMIDDQNHPGMSPFSPQGYKVWRNVKDFGAKGDGTTDDTAAINRAIADGARCGENCHTSTVAPAVVYFPAGTYLVSSSIIQYYNTQFLGDPNNLPTILAASSFVGLGVISSNKYVEDNVGWYLNTANFLRSIKNFKIDIRLTDPYAYVCAIHWQVAQATSLENIFFYMQYNSDIPGNTQQGIYMENGSGGFLSDLTFVGGNFGAYFGNQQFTTSGLTFVNCQTALQIHWDWAWTMQGFVIESCNTGLIVTGGAGGSHSTGQSVGSVVLADSLIANTWNGVVTSLHSENSTSLLLQNVGFFNVHDAVTDSFANRVLLPGGNQVVIDSWGFGKVTDAEGSGKFVNGEHIPAMTRPEGLLGEAYNNMKPSLFTRRRPKYYDVPASKVMNVRALGAKGDGKTDDTAVLNSILDGAANTSSIVYFPFGVYIIKDTLRVPMGSRIIGQAWSQIMATGANFEDEMKPRVAVQVGRRGDLPGIMEIQDMMFTVSGPTAGAVLVEWNARESSKGSVGMWDSHFRVGGAIGSKLQKSDCPTGTGSVNPKCKAASMLLHMTPDSTGYLENVWAWVADHDLDDKDESQLDIYVARGMLIESKLAWLWGTSSEHSVFYQYQLSGARNIYMGMIQTETPYYQPVPKAPTPFRPGLFPNDPTFPDVKDGTPGCFSAWAVRIIDSSSVYMLGAGIYSWFSDYSQKCVDTNDCQNRAFEVQQSSDLWIYNLCTKAIVEMVSPWQGVATLARDNVNGYLSSVLAWLQGAGENVSGRRQFQGYQVYTLDSLRNVDAPDTCKTALTSKILCDEWVARFQEAEYRGSLGNKTLTDSVCDEGCQESLAYWFVTVETSCHGFNISDQLPTTLGGRIWAGVNETCIKDSKTEAYCNEVIDKFTTVETIEDMPHSELCSECYVGKLAMMQRSSYSAYDEWYMSDLEFVNKQCGLNLPTSLPPSLDPVYDDDNGEADSGFCVSDKMYTVASEGESCEQVAKANSVSPAGLYNINPSIQSCSLIRGGTELCLPLSCGSIISFSGEDTCTDLEMAKELEIGSLRAYNPWINSDCSNLATGGRTFGWILCGAPQNGAYEHTTPGAIGDTTTPGTGSDFTHYAIDPPEGVTVAEGTTTTQCGRWKVADEGDGCASICLSAGIHVSLLQAANPALGTKSEECSGKVEAGVAYCTGPTYSWSK